MIIICTQVVDVLLTGAIDNSISTIIVGKNKIWKQSINIGKSNNQQFVNVPHSKLIQMIKYKAELAGIDVVVTEESYSSQSSFLDHDSLPSTLTFLIRGIGQFSPILQSKIQNYPNQSLNIKLSKH